MKRVRYRGSQPKRLSPTSPEPTEATSGERDTGELVKEEPAPPNKNPSPRSWFSIASNLVRPLGLSLAVLLAFLCGIVFRERQILQLQRERNSVSSPAEFRARFSTTQAEPEDFFPAAEFRRQGALLFGCHTFLNTNPQLYVDIARAIDRRLPVFALVQSESQARQGRDLMTRNKVPVDAMRFVVLPADTVWVRDYAPFMIRRPDNSIAMIDAKYQLPFGVEERRRDEEMAIALSECLGLPIRSIPLVLEGGNFLSNGDGIALATDRLFYKNQEYEFSEVQIATMLNDFLGVRRCHLVPALEGEATGHADMLMCFAAKNIAVVGEIPLEIDPENSRRLDATADILKQIVTTMGPLKVFRIPMPPPSRQCWRSYTNVVFANGIILMPSFSDVDPALEDRAQSVYELALPGWKVKRIPCDRLVNEHGQLHCISYNIPNYVNLDHLMAKSM